MFINTNVADTGTGKKKKDNQRNGFENPRIENDYKLTDAELKAAQEVSYKRYMQDQQKYDLIARQTGTLGRSIYDRLGKKGFMTGDELDAIYNDIETYQSNLRLLKSVGFDDGGALDQINSMFSVTSGMKNIYSQFGNAEEYNGAILSGNFQFDDDAEGRSERSRIYGENQSRIAELEKRIAEKEKNGEDTSADEELLELLEAQNRQYERGNKISDDFYAKYFGTDDYQKYSGKRGFSNPSGTDMQKDEMRNDSSLWKYDAEGNCYNVYGELVHDKNGNAGPGYVIENGTIRTSGAQNINDPLGLFLAAQKNGDLDNATGTPVDMEDYYIKFLKDANDAAWQELSKDEVGIYYTILNSQGVEAATQYLSDMRNTLTARYVAKEQKRMITSLDEGGFLLNAAYSLASVPMNMIGGAAAAVEGAANALGYGEYNPNSPANQPQIYAETGRSTISKNLDELTGNAKLLGISLGDIYQFGMSSIDSFVGKVAGRGYTIIMGMGAASSKARELYDKGASPDQIISNAIITGALEIVTEYVSIDKLLTAKSAKTFTQYLKNILKQAGVEASEEIASEIGNIIADEAIMGSQGEVEQGVSELMEEGLSEIEAYKKYIVDRVYKAGVGGFLSGGLSAGVYSGVNYVGNDISLKQEGRRILDTDNGVEDLRSLANEMAGVKEGETQSREQRRLSRYSDRAGKKQSAKNVGLLSDQVDTVRMEQNANDIAADLVKIGYKEKYARKIADAIVQVNEGAADTETEQRYNKYMSDSAIASVNDRFYGNEDSSVQTRNAEYQMRRNGTAVRNAVNEVVRGMTEADIDEKIENVKQNYASSDNSGSDVIADTGEAIRSMRVLSVKDGKMTVEVTLEDGKTKTVDASKIDYARQDKATIYGYLAENNMVAGAVQTLVDNYTGKTDSDLKTYLLGVEEAYQYGYYGRAMQNLQFAQDLAPNQRTAAFRAGQIAAKMDLGEENARVKRAQAQAAIRQNGHRTDGRVSFEGDQKSFENLSQRQQATVDLAQQMAKVFGNHYHFFVSQTVDGKHMLDGKEVENGWYDTRSGDIWVDLNAGAKGEGLALFTITHELTHFIRQWAPSQFRALSSALVTAYEGKNVPISQLVRSQQELARKHGRTLSYDEAWEEVVANSMEGITQDGRLYEVAMQLKQENRTLWQKVKDWFADILARLKKAYAGLTPDSREANLMLQMTDQVEAMQKAWAEGLNTASQNFQSADGTMQSEKNTATDGGVKYSVKNTRKMTWDEQMNALFSTKSLKSSDSLYLGKSEQFLEEAGIPQSTEYIPLGVVTKAMRKQSGSRSAHAMTDGQIRDLKKEINNAPAVIVNPSRNAVVYITNQPNSGGYTVVSFDINNDLFGENAHKSTSIHPQISVRNLVNSLGEDATIFVRNENRFNEIAGLLSDNPPTLLATIKSVEAMVTHDNIKSQAEISDKKLSIRQDTEYLSVAEKYRDGTATEAEIEQLRKMVDEAAKKAGYTSDTDWRMDHKAPNAKYDVPIYQVDTLYGGDGSIYSNRAAYYYGDGRSYDQKAIRVLQKVRNNPNADITVYRAVPTNRVESHVRNGDWVTTVEEYAKEHGDRVLDGEYRIIKNTVPAKYVYANGDSIHEYGYDDGKDYGYRNTENNRKLLDLVTYDDNGNIIPLSERFNPEKSDIRWSARQEESYSTKSILTQLNADTVSQLDADGKKLLQSYQRMAKRADYYRNQIDQLRAEKNAWKGKSIHAGSVLNSALASKNAEINELQRKLENTEKIMAGQVRNPQIARLVNTARDQAVKQLRAEKNAKIAQIRQEKNAQIDRVRTQYQTSIANAREGRAVTELRGKIRKVAEDIKGRMTAPSDARYIPLGLAQSVVDLSDILDYAPSEGTKARAKYDSVSEAVHHLAAEYKKLADDSDYAFASEFDDVLHKQISDIAETLRGRNIRELTKSELQQVYDSVRVVRDTLRSATKLIGVNGAQDVYEAADSVVAQQKNIQKLAEDRGRANKLLHNLLHRSNLDGISFMRAVEMLSGWDKDSTLYKLVAAIEDGKEVSYDYVMKYNKLFQFLKTGKNEKIYHDATNKRLDIGIKDTDGKPVLMTKMQMMQAIMTWDREAHNDKLAHMQQTGIKVRNANLIQDGKVEEASKTAQLVKVTPQMISEMRSRLTAWDKQFMVKIRNYFKGETTAVNDVMYQLKHRVLQAEEFYIPEVVDSNYLIAELGKDDTFNIFVKEPGATNVLKTRAKQPIIIDGLETVMSKHVTDMGNYVGMAIPIRNFAKVFNGMNLNMDEPMSVKDSISKSFGDHANEILMQGMRDVQGGRSQTRIDRLSRKMTGLYSAFNKLALVGKAGVTIKQAASYQSAGSIISRRALIFGNRAFVNSADQSHSFGLISHLFMSPDGKTAQRLFNEIDQHTPLHYQRRLGMSMQEIAFEKLRSTKLKRFLQGVGASLEQNKLGSFVRSSGEWLNPVNWIQRMDVATTGALWVACKYQAKLDGYEIGSDEFWTHTTDLYKRVIRETQPMYDSLHRAEVQKGEGFTKYLFPFKTVPFQNKGQIFSAIGEYATALKTGTKAETKAAAKYAYNTVAANVRSAMIFAALSLVAGAVQHKMKRYRDDDNELTLSSIGETYFSDFLGVIASNASPLFGNEIIEFIYGRIDHARDEDDSWAYDLFQVGMLDLINDTYESLVAFTDGAIDLFSGDMAFGDFANVASSAIMQFAAFFGIPAQNVVDLFSAVSLHIQDTQSDGFLSFSSDKPQTKKNISALLYEAIVNGNTADIEKYSAQFDTDKKLHNAIRDQLKKNDARITDAAVALEGGNVAEYERIIKEIVGEGHFTEDDVVAAIRSQKDSIKNAIAKVYDIFFGDGTEEATAKKMYSTEDYVNAATGGQTASANNAKEYLISDYMDKGYTREEAEKKFYSSVCSEITKRYKNDGNPSDQNYINLYIQYGGMSEQNAADKVKGLSFNRQNPDYDWSASTIDLYYENAQPEGISMKVFDSFITTYNRTEPDYDSNGNAVRNSKMYKVAEYIESLDIPKEQKEALFLCEYSQKSLKKVRFT